MNKYLDALDFAKKWHGDQTRKYTGDPYWFHLRDVSKIVLGHGGDDDMVIAAILHDVLEDTPATPADLSPFGWTVIWYVMALTDPLLSSGNRKARKAATIARLAAAPDAVKTIKLADLIDNSDSIIRHDPNFAKVFMSEKKALLPSLLGGDPRLYKLATDIIDDYYRRANAPI